MVTTVLPVGLRGLVVAGLLAALMSSLSSVFNSTSTLITFDIYKKFRPTVSDRELVNAGRLSTIALVLLGMAWIPLMQAIEGGLFQKLQSVQAYISPPIAAAFCWEYSLKDKFRRCQMGIDIRWSLGCKQISLEIADLENPVFIEWFIGMNFLHFALFLFAICSLVLVSVSLANPTAQSYEDSSLVWSKETRYMSSTTRVLTFLLIICVVTLWVVF